MSDPIQTQVPPQMPPKKKGLHPLAWVGIGCGGLTLIGLIVIGLISWFAYTKVKELARNPAKASAELMVQANPDIEKVSENETAGEMTIRVKSTGEEITLKYNELANGKISIKDKDGNISVLGQGDLSKVPAWVPRYPGIADEATSFQVENSGKHSGVLSGTTSDSVDAIKNFYDGNAPTGSFTSKGHSIYNDGTTSKLSLNYSDGSKSLRIEAFGENGQTKIQTFYSE